MWFTETPYVCHWVVITIHIRSDAMVRPNAAQSRVRHWALRESG